MNRALQARLQQQASATRRHELPRSGNLSRRDFIGGGLAMALGLPPLLGSCGGGGDDDTPPRPTHRRTLFFNLSHEQHAGKTYWVTGGGQRLKLTPVAEQPEVLRRERESSAFLRGVADEHITHHVDAATFASDSTTLLYVSSEIDTQAGTWSMSSIQLYIPPDGTSGAYAAARKKTPSGPLPMSAKRRRYGLPAAASEQDLREERALLDTTSHASTLVGCHPDLMSLEPVSAHIVHSNHIDQSINVAILDGNLQQPQYGTATPAATFGQPNATGWATLQPVPSGDLGSAPLKNTKGQHAGRNQYQPSLHPDLRGVASAAMNDAIPDVKNDESLGADVTGLHPSQTSEIATRLKGALWMRQDGQTTVVHGASAAADGSGVAASSAAMSLSDSTPQWGYHVTADVAPSGSAQKVSLTLINWYLNFRGVYLQFLDGDTVLNLADIPEYVNGTIVANHDKISDTAQEMFVSMIGPVFTIFAIPVAPGFIQPSFTVPEKATTVRILASGLSFEGGNAYPQTVLPGAIMTGIFNYGVTVLLCAAGAAVALNGLSKAIVPGLQFLAQEMVAIMSAALNPNNGDLIAQMGTAGFWESQALVLAKTLLSSAAGPYVKSMVVYVIAAITEASFEDSIPLAGAIMLGVSIAAGVGQLIETSVELGTTPWTFVDDLVFTHDLSVTLQRDDNDHTFPKAANSYTVTAMFDDGTPHSQTLALPAPTNTLPPVVFTSVPLGGNVNVSVAFNQKATVPGQDDILLGKGTTGAVANDVDALTLKITEIAFPISSATKYQHRQKTQLDGAGNHLWVTAAAPTVNASNSPCGAGGTACGFRGISVRQGTSTAQGYVGYAWQSQNSDPNRAPSCAGGGAGQLDQLANLNTDAGTNGTGAQNGYANGSCGIGVGGVKVAYNLLSNGQRNFYLDTTDPDAPMVRQVVLEPAPQFDSPTSNRSWGVLNMASDTLLLHPAGHLVSINQTNHKIETLRMPKQFMDDASAKINLLALPKSGQGSRPGLIDTPAAAAVGPSGVILVLETGNNRIQAFDLGANPVRHFSKQSGPGTSPYHLTLGGTDPSQGWTYLDLAVEYTGYLYVLSYNQNTFEYRLDLYHPDQTGGNPIATTRNIYAAKLAVDLWRNLYTLNYELLQMPSGSPAPLTEPSVSLWTPCDVGQTC
jgi:hypothetical protein